MPVTCQFGFPEVEHPKGEGGGNVVFCALETLTANCFYPGAGLFVIHTSCGIKDSGMLTNHSHSSHMCYLEKQPSVKNSPLQPLPL